MPDWKMRLKLRPDIGFILIACVGFAFGLPAHANGFRLTTWNMDWLTLRTPGTDSDLPPNIPHRHDKDYAALATYAQRLHASLIAFQEADGAEVARRIFPASEYRLFLTDDKIIQRVGIAADLALQITRNPDLTALNVYSSQAAHPLRSGLDITVNFSSSNLRILVVHLKTGCWDDPLPSRKQVCQVLQKQAAILRMWLSQRQEDHVPFVIMGDFNRRLAPHDDFFLELTQGINLALPTTGMASPCHGGEYFIDNILLGNGAQNWLQPNSLKVMTFANERPEDAERLSDHCPVSIGLTPK
ncbi:MAG: endonuclease/exonuclease/phosphatase family protein [Acetobacter sp.]|nr:endonuclease/exonuclease/phosphatase family protein [Acetobacter sp.]MCI1320597.1 endonuclease/exonuclease/phosphatase family protein [Acetobacter sp.]MCI1373896.1 endonuclease/exonuclease/phosphatase family protein [Acetobacter sp.]MCI1413908.1 endonuclease/exonuclease/phosphatase family protein [Acetobacter sp.]MCI1442329.1 endonuclease/exonuclease/phosphatase family protein [Acetobacter sp.]